MGKREKFLNRTVLFLLLFSFLWPFAFCGEASAGASSLKVRQAYLDFPDLTVYADLLDSSGKKLEPSEGDQLRATVGDRAFGLSEWKPFSVEEEGMATIFLVDVSGSIKPKRFEELQKTLSAWIGRMGPKDRAALVSFGERVKVVQDFTAEQNALLYGVKSLKPLDSHTQLNQGLIRALELARKKGPELPRRKMILLCTDGLDDMPGSVTLDEVRDALATDPVPVYSVFFDDDKMTRVVRDAALKSLGEFSRRSKGELYDAKAAPFPVLFEKINQSLNDSLVLQFQLKGFKPDGTAKRLEISYSNGSMTLSDGIQIRTELPVREKKLPQWIYFVAAGIALLLVATLVALTRRKKKLPDASPAAGNPVTVSNQTQGGTVQVPRAPVALKPSTPAVSLELIATATSVPSASYKVTFGDRLVLGRNAGESALAIPGDGTISGRHCELVFSAGKLFVRDLQSTNGTFVNGVPIQGNFPIKDGDRLTLGKTELRLRITGVQ